MAFQSLSFRSEIALDDFPHRWLPLAYLYDPDLPLFPTHYFHALQPAANADSPLDSDRVYGYVEALRLSHGGGAVATVVCNRELESSGSGPFRASVVEEVRHRLGLGNPVVATDVTSTFGGTNARANSVLERLWARVVANAYGDKLPFGRIWDPILGLARWVASWNSDGGRKGELIQTHYFASRFGERISSSGELPQVDFYLLPTLQEVRGTSPLFSFPKFAQLSRAVDELIAFAPKSGHKPFDRVSIKSLSLTRFRQPAGSGRFDTARLQQLLGLALGQGASHRAMVECYNAFNKGPPRTLIFAMMFDDLKSGRLVPEALSFGDVAALYKGLKSTYQSPKAIAIYAQQCFGNPNAVPLDTWVKTFLEHPLALLPEQARTDLSLLKPAPIGLGKTERLLWVAAQARKVHSSAADDVLWCLKFSSERDATGRGANPLACGVCHVAVRSVCPAFEDIAQASVVFNGPVPISGFALRTSAASNSQPGQLILESIGGVGGGQKKDDFTAQDVPERLKQYPQSEQSNGAPMTVSDFVKRYGV